MKPSQPQVSVLMSVYNGANFVATAVEAILAQTFRDFEFIIVDDGSTDATPKILAGFTDPRIRILTCKTNLGIPRATNLGLAECRGEFIARTDCDDVSDPRRLQLQMEYMEQHPEVGLLGTHIYLCYHHGKRRAYQVQKFPASVTYLELLLNDCQIAHSAVLMRKSVVAAVGGYNELMKYSLDYDLWLRITRRFGAANLQEILVIRHRHPKSVSDSQRSEQWLYAELARALSCNRISGELLHKIYCEGATAYAATLTPAQREIYKLKAFAQKNDSKTSALTLAHEPELKVVNVHKARRTRKIIFAVGVIFGLFVGVLGGLLF